MKTLIFLASAQTCQFLGAEQDKDYESWTEPLD